MSDLTEREVLDRLETAIGDAVDACKSLAVHSVAGSPYDKLRENLALIEGCCRQLAAFRLDTRWLPYGRMAADCHARAGGWLRGFKHPETGARIATAAGQKNRLFLMLGMNLLDMRVAAIKLFNDRTGMGDKPILPGHMTPIAETRREGRPAFTVPTKKPALILPPRLRTANG